MKFSQTPWGRPDSEEAFPHGIFFVSTPSHGGFLVPKAYADTHFSEYHLTAANSCCNLRMVPRGYYAFEEDCAALAVVCEVPEAKGDLSLEDAEAMFNNWFGKKSH